MLVLSRYKDQSIYIGDDIVVTIVDVRGDRIRLGIEAPSTVPVHRQEIYEAIRRENAASDVDEGAVCAVAVDGTATATRRVVREKNAADFEISLQR
ncbi:MAG: carbon storage regulator CsrA [Thermoguttaceae bacterium]|nr:carbon storage regulator CsrA [Thermoguttaceae bacterium]MBQ9799272.1 carbon storage regulator CsrA [Thermoguttaceae bacterium]